MTDLERQFGLLRLVIPRHVLDGGKGDAVFDLILDPATQRWCIVSPVSAPGSSLVMWMQVEPERLYCG